MSIVMVSTVGNQRADMFDSESASKQVKTDIHVLNIEILFEVIAVHTSFHPFRCQLPTQSTPPSFDHFTREHPAVVSPMERGTSIQRSYVDNHHACVSRLMTCSR